MHPLGLIIYPLMVLAFGLFVATLVELVAVLKEEPFKRKRRLRQMIGAFALFILTVIGLSIALYFAVTPMYYEAPRIEGHYASDVPPDEIIPLEDDYCLALYESRGNYYYSIGIFHTKEKDGKTLYRFEEDLVLHITSEQRDLYGWWESDFAEYHYYGEWTQLSEKIYGAVCPKDGDVVPDANHTATITREVTVDGEVFVVYIAIE